VAARLPPGDRALLHVGHVHEHRRVVAGPDVDPAAAGLVGGDVLEERRFAVVLHALQHDGEVGVEHGISFGSRV
jgi:hypothetical protein